MKNFKDKLINFISTKEFLILVFLLILASVFRFWHLSQLQYFNIDEEWEAFFSQRIFIEKRPVLIGGGFPGGFYMGPLFRYFASTIYFFSRFDPVGAGFAASILGVISVGLVFWVGSLFANKKVGLLAGFFYSLSYLIVIYNRTLWPLSWAPVVTLLSYLSLFKIAIEKKTRYMLLLGLAIAMGINSDPSTLSLIILAFFILLPIKKIRSKPILISFFSIILIAIIPVFLFDLRHDFFNIKKAVGLFSFSGKSTTSAQSNFSNMFTIVPILGRTFSRIVWISGPWDVVKQILPCDMLLKDRERVIPVYFWGSYLILITFLFQTIKLKQFGLSLVSGHLLTILGGVMTYNFLQPGYTHEWFFSIYYPSFCLILAYSVFWALKKTYLQLPVIFLIIVFIIIQTLSLFYGTNSAGMALKKAAVQYAVSQIKNEPFYMNALSSCYAYGGYRYLFRYYKTDPAKSFMDDAYSGWLYKPYVGPPPNKGVIIMNFTQPVEEKALPRYERYKKKAINRARFGNIEVLIVDGPDINE